MISLNKLFSKKSLQFLCAACLLCPLFSLSATTIFEGDLPVDERIKIGELENGLKYVYYPWAEPEGRLSLRLVVLAGSIHEEDTQQGLAHFIEHMAFNGTENFSPGDMVEYFQRLGMSFGADTNAHTWWRETVYKLELPEINDGLLDDSFMLLRDYADRMTMSQEEIDKERGVVISEMRERQSPASDAYMDGLRFALPDSIISKRLTIGDKEILQAAQQDVFLDYYRKWYTPDRMLLVVVGDTSFETIESQIEAHFADMPKPEVPVPDPEIGFINVGGETKFKLFSHPELSQIEIDVYSRRQIEREADTLERKIEEIKLQLADSAFDRRFDRIVKSEGSPIISGNAYDYEWLNFLRMTGVTVNAKEGTWEDALALAIAEQRKAAQFGFTEVELNEAKATYLNALKVASDGNASRKSRDISAFLVRAIVDGFIPMDPTASYEKLKPIVEAITLDSINQTFAEAWANEDRMVHISGNFEPGVAEIYNMALNKEVLPPEVEEVKPFVYTDFGPEGKIKNEEIIEDLDILQVSFENNVGLSLKKTDYKAGEVLVKVRIGNGQLTAPSTKPGLSLASSAMFITGGLGEHSIDDLRGLMAGRKLSYSFVAEQDAFTLSGTTNEEDLLTQLQVLAAFVTDPGYRPEAQRVVAQQLGPLYQQLKHLSQGVLQNEVESFLAGGDFRFGYPELEDLQQRTLDDVREWLGSALESGYMEIAIVGDFEDSDSVVSAVSKTFGALAKRDSKLDKLSEFRVLEFPSGSEETISFSYQSEQDQSLAMVHWPTTDRSDIFETRKLSVLANIFTDRLRIVVREGDGASYSPYSFNNSSDVFDDYGYFRAVAGTSSDNTQSTIDSILSISDDLVSNGITEDELLRAIEPIKTSIQEYRRTNAYWLNSVLLSSLADPRQLDWARSFAGFWDTVKVEDIQPLIEKYLKNDRAVPVEIVPKS